MMLRRKGSVEEIGNIRKSFDFLSLNLTIPEEKIFEEMRN